MGIVPLLGDRSAGSIVDGTYLSSAVATTRPSGGTAFDSSGTLVTYGNNILRPDFDPVTQLFRGWLIEGARTNGIANNTMQGALVSPSTIPTGWTAGFNAGSTGVTATVTALNTVSGFSTISIRLQGTPSANDNFAISPVGSTAAPVAANGETWSSSAYISLRGGSLTNILNVRLNMKERTSAGVFISEAATADFQSSLTGTLQRFTQTRALTGGVTVGRAQPQIYIGMTSGAAVDITLTIAAPQMELGGFASSVILTTGATATRAADSPVISSLASIGFNALAGTILAEFEYAGLVVAEGQNIVNVNDNTITNNTNIFKQVGGNPMQGGVGGASSTVTPAAATGTIYRAALAYETGNNSFWLNGTEYSGAGFIAATPLATVTRMNIGNRSDGLRPMFGWIRRLTYFNSRLPNATLQSLTT